jgi:carbonic anhydrase
LGYRPKHLICTVSYAPDGTTTPRQIGSTDAWAVLKEMRPMSNGDAHDIQQLHKEEARALAVVVDRILERAGTM